MEHTIRAGAGTGVLKFPEDYFPSDGFSGVHDDMHAKALLLTQGQTRGAIVTLELPSIRPWELTDALRAYAADLLEVPYDNLWLVMTHDLAAPHVPKTEAGRRVHMDILKNAVKTACEGAQANLQPVCISYAEGRCDINANRDMESAEGWWVGIRGDGPSDKTLTLLRFDGIDGRPAAVLYNYALKSSVLEAAPMSDGKQYASGDVTGAAGVIAEARLGCPVLFMMGAAGDQVPKKKASYLELDENRHFYSVNLKEEGYAILEELAQELADAVCAAAGQPGVPVTSDLDFGHFAFHADGQIPYSNDLPQPPVRHFDYVPAPGEDIPVWYLRLGSLILLGIKPEILTPTFQALQSRSPFAHTLMAALVNGGQGYIARDIDYDHYTYPGLKTPFRRGTDQVFLREVSRFLEHLYSSREGLC